MHRGVHVAGIEDEHARRGAVELGGEHARDVFERGLRRAIAAPGFVSFNAGVRRKVDDRCNLGASHQLERMLGEMNRREDVDGEERIERLAVELVDARKGGLAERRGVIDE